MFAPNGVRVRLKARPQPDHGENVQDRRHHHASRSILFRNPHRADLLLLRCKCIAIMRLGGCLVAFLKEALLQGQLGLAKVDAGEFLAWIASSGLCHIEFLVVVLAGTRSAVHGDGM